MVLRLKVSVPPKIEMSFGENYLSNLGVLQVIFKKKNYIKEIARNPLSLAVFERRTMNLLPRVFLLIIMFL